MLDKDSLPLGIFIGLAVPFVGYAVFLMLMEYIASAEWLSGETRSIYFRTRTLVVFAICLNIIPFRIYQKLWRQTTMRGILIATFICVSFWIYQFSSGLF